MNGPDVLSAARQQLAHTICKHSPLAPAPLFISPWVAMALLQKSIRRGHKQLAHRAAATLLLNSPERLWRRCGCIAFEDVGVADIETVSQVTAALAGKRFRSKIGGEWAVASFIVSRMTQAPKCRAADDLLLAAENHLAFERARLDLTFKTTAELIRLGTGQDQLPVHGEFVITLRSASGIDHDNGAAKRSGQGRLGREAVCQIVLAECGR